MGPGEGHAPNIWTGGHYHKCPPVIRGVESSQVVSIPLVELWILCNVLFLCMAPFNHKAVMVKIRYIFQLILAVDFMAFISPKRTFYFNVDKASASGTPYHGLCPWTLLKDLRPPDPMRCPAHPCRQIDAYVFTEHFNGPCKAAVLVCASVSVCPGNNFQRKWRLTQIVCTQVHLDPVYM